jgi:hypothetical protein
MRVLQRRRRAWESCQARAGEQLPVGLQHAAFLALAPWRCSAGCCAVAVLHIQPHEAPAARPGPGAVERGAALGSRAGQRAGGPGAGPWLFVEGDLLWVARKGPGGPRNGRSWRTQRPAAAGARRGGPFSGWRMIRRLPGKPGGDFAPRIGLDGLVGCRCAPRSAGRCARPARATAFNPLGMQGIRSSFPIFGSTRNCRAARARTGRWCPLARKSSGCPGFRLAHPSGCGTGTRRLLVLRLERIKNFPARD